MEVRTLRAAGWSELSPRPRGYWFRLARPPQMLAEPFCSPKRESLAKGENRPCDRTAVRRVRTQGLPFGSVTASGELRSHLMMQRSLAREKLVAACAVGREPDLRTQR